MKQRMQRFIAIPALLGLLTVGACKELNVPDFNNPSLEDLEQNPTPSAISAAAIGVLIGGAAQHPARGGYVSVLGMIGRESFRFDPADPRFFTSFLNGLLDPGTFGAGLWAGPYDNIRNANILLKALELVVGLSAAEQEAVRGFAKTIKALEYLEIINTRDINGAIINVDADPSGDPAPIQTKGEVFALIVQLLDEAQTHLQGAGSTAFPFPLTSVSGFAGFDTPATFLTFNRALKARVDVYMGNFTLALTSLGASFLDAGGAFDLGVYWNYGSGAGQASNRLFDPDGSEIFAHTSIATDAQLKADLNPDDRFTNKIVMLPAPVTFPGGGVSSDMLFQIYNSTSATVTIIRNEELILLRAEANIGAGTPDAALPDINLIRQTAGGLDAIPLATWQAMTATQQLDELLYNKRYSLMFEGGHRWIDMRRYGKLGELPLDLPGHVVVQRFPIPLDECRARSLPETCGLNP